MCSPGHCVREMSGCKAYVWNRWVADDLGMFVHFCVLLLVATLVRTSFLDCMCLVVVGSAGLLCCRDALSGACMHSCV